MKIDIEQFLTDHGITHSTQSKNVSLGWIGVQCPFCDDHSDHGGFSPSGTGYHCWRCGDKFFVSALARLLGEEESKIDFLLRPYRVARGGAKTRKIDRRSPIKLRGRQVNFPRGTTPLQPPHRKYLENRGFDPDVITNQWEVQGTGPKALLGGVDYGFRLIVPIHHQGRLVSFQGRDITDRATQKYKACPRSLEAMHHKHTLYGLDQVRGKDRVLVVEGVFDVWRVGPGAAVATFGIEYTMEQVALLNKFRKVYILFDSERQAQEKAHELSRELPHPKVLEPEKEGDPAEFPHRSIVRLRKLVGI